MIREAYKVYDIHKVMYELLTELTTTTVPWTDWATVYGWPETEVFDKLDKPFIYVLKPQKSGNVWQQGGLTMRTYEMYIGGWDDRNTGGPATISVIDSAITAFFENPQTCHSTEFTVTLDSTYTNTTIKEMGIVVENISGGEWKDVGDKNEFRIEFVLTLRA